MKWGPYNIQVTRRSNCRRMILHYHPAERRLTMSVPSTATGSEIAAFLSSRRAWMDERMQEEAPWQPAWEAGERHLLLGQYVTLGENGIPTGRVAVERYRTQMLAESLKRLLPIWEKRMNVHVERVTIKEMSSRWGSCCAQRGTLSINAKLARVPEGLTEQVLVHELCHLLHSDHSPAFYAALTHYLPDWKARKKQLDAYDIRPLPAFGERNDLAAEDGGQLLARISSP